jgi:hypothetical protein
MFVNFYKFKNIYIYIYIWFRIHSLLVLHGYIDDGFLYIIWKLSLSLPTSIVSSISLEIVLFIGYR